MIDQGGSDDQWQAQAGNPADPLDRDLSGQMDDNNAGKEHKYKEEEMMKTAEAMAAFLKKNLLKEPSKEDAAKKKKDHETGADLSFFCASDDLF
jgi:hypothetical protein